MSPLELVVNLGGEGEPVAGDLIVNVNLMHRGVLMRSGFAQVLSDTQVVVAASASRIPLRDRAADGVVANRFPIQYNALVDGTTIDDLAAEVARVLRPSGRIHFHCASCDVTALAFAFEAQGISVELPFRQGYPLEGWRR